MRILVVQNNRRTHAGAVGEALAEHGAALDVVRADEGEPLPDGTAGHDGMLVLGGPQDAWDDSRAPYFPKAMELIRAFAERGKPVLGICLGAQLAARAFGARVYRHTAPEIGFVPVRFTGAAQRDPLLRGLGPERALMQWHYDTFDLPDGAVRLATGEACENQAFRLGPALWGVQFHPEATAEIIGAWAARHHAQTGRAVEGIEDQVARHLPGQAAFARTLAARWLGLTRAG